MYATKPYLYALFSRFNKPSTNVLVTPFFLLLSVPFRLFAVFSYKPPRFVPPVIQFPYPHGTTTTTTTAHILPFCFSLFRAALCHTSPERVSATVATVQKIVLLLSHHDLLALHSGELGRIRNNARWWRWNRRLSTGFTEPCAGIKHGTLNWIHGRLVDLGRLARLWWRCGSNLVLVHLRMHRLCRDGRDGGRCGRVRWRWCRCELGLWRRIHAPAITVERLWHDSGRIWRIGRRHTGDHGVVRRRQLCVCRKLTVHVLLICGLLCSIIRRISIGSFVVHGCKLGVFNVFVLVASRFSQALFRFFFSTSFLPGQLVRQSLGSHGSNFTSILYVNL